jgi:hypothetical protein
MCNIPQSSSAFQTPIQPQRPGRFLQCLTKKGERIVRWVIHLKKEDIEYPFEHAEVINHTLDGVSIHPVTTKIQASFLTQLPERKETGFNSCDRRKLRMAQQHCSYSTILT